MTLRSDLPMHLMGALYKEGEEAVKFLFYYPDANNPSDWRKGRGCALLLHKPRIWVPGDQDEPEYELDLNALKDYTDKLTGDAGVACGIGISKTDVQIVDYNGPEWMFHIVTRSLAYSGVIDLESMQM